MSLDASAIGNAIGNSWSGRCQLDLFESLDSTSRFLGRQLDDNPALSLPRLCVTAHQTAGVGRRGRAWHSPVDSITLSVIQRFNQPASSLMGLSLVTGIAIAELLNTNIAPNSDDSVQVKWPNDLMARHQKLAGILIEIPRSTQSSATVITGAGINYAMGDELLQVDQPFTLLQSLTDDLPERNHLIGLIAGHLLRVYDEFSISGWSAFAKRWQTLDYLQGKKVTILPAGCARSASTASPNTGVASGVAEDGGLIVNQAGTPKTYYSGEISVRAD